MTDLSAIRKRYASDKREHPLIIAEVWSFPLQHYERDDGHLYAVQDWVGGLSSSTTVKASEAWRQMDQTRISITSLPYTAADGKTYQRDYTNQQGLYLIAQQLRSTKTRPALAAIKAYLAAAGVFVDDVRRNPDHAIDAAIESYSQQGKTNVWIGERLDGKIARKAFTDALDNAVAIVLTGREYAEATDVIYTRLWNRTAAALRGEMGLKKSQSLRDHQPTIALAYQRIAEATAAQKLGDKTLITWEEARSIVSVVAAMIGAQAKQTGELLKMDLATGKPLLDD
ncbi:MAG: hypothetical protein ABI700_00780 [Chloroflexota bacterium]